MCRSVTVWPKSGTVSLRTSSQSLVISGNLYPSHRRMRTEQMASLKTQPRFVLCARWVLTHVFYLCFMTLFFSQLRFTLRLSLVKSPMDSKFFFSRLWFPLNFLAPQRSFFRACVHVHKTVGQTSCSMLFCLSNSDSHMVTGKIVAYLQDITCVFFSGRRNSLKLLSWKVTTSK